MCLSDQDILEIGWELLGHKAAYYIWHSPIISDTEYDVLEALWEKYSGRKAPVDFPLDSPSAMLVLRDPNITVTRLLSTLNKRRELIANISKDI